MPELPEVETTRRGIRRYILQQPVQQVILRHHQLRHPIPNAIKTVLINQPVLAIKRRAKYLLLQFPQGTLLIHLGMSGSLRILREPTPPSKHDHMDIIFANGNVLRFNDPRRFGTVLWLTDPVMQHPLLAHLGPEPLTKNFNADYLFQQSHSRHIPIKQLLMDHKVVVGVGNIYASEALFLANINPKRAANKITHADAEAIVHAVKQVLNAALKAGGTTLRNYANHDGKPGYFKLQLQVYGRTGQPCHVCQSLIKQIKQGQRSTYYCPKCQA